MKKSYVQPILLLFIASISSAVLSLPLVSAWSWDSYEGKTSWNAVITVDEKGCGGGVNSKSISLTISHKKDKADLSDFGHGAVSGTFFSNILTIPGRTIPDGSGSSALGAASVTFTPDCLSFYTKYPWRYKDSYQDCSGTTSLKGTRTDAKECPGAFVVTELTPSVATASAPVEKKVNPIAEARKLSASEQKAAYKKILEKDPNNFWANYDLAQIVKKEKDYAEYDKYLDNALKDRKAAEKMNKILREDTQKKLKLSEQPTYGKCPLLRSAKDDLDTSRGEMIYNFNVLKQPDNRNWYEKVRDYLSDRVNDVAYKTGEE